MEINIKKKGIVIFKEGDITEEEKRMCLVETRTPDGLWYCRISLFNKNCYAIIKGISSYSELLNYIYS